MDRESHWQMLLFAPQLWVRHVLARHHRPAVSNPLFALVGNR